MPGKPEQLFFIVIAAAAEAACSLVAFSNCSVRMSLVAVVVSPLSIAVRTYSSSLLVAPGQRSRQRAAIQIRSQIF